MKLLEHMWHFYQLLQYMDYTTLHYAKNSYLCGMLWLGQREKRLMLPCAMDPALACIVRSGHRSLLCRLGKCRVSVPARLGGIEMVGVLQVVEGGFGAGDREEWSRGAGVWCYALSVQMLINRDDFGPHPSVKKSGDGRVSVD
jgi:hypothetical protein